MFEIVHEGCSRGTPLSGEMSSFERVQLLPRYFACGAHRYGGCSCGSVLKRGLPAVAKWF